LVGTPQTLYKDFPASRPQPDEAPQRGHRWLLYLSLALLLLFLGGGVIALAVFGPKLFPTASGNTNQAPEIRTAVAPTPTSSPEPTAEPSPSPHTDKDLVGAWRTHVTEQGQKWEITVTFLQDGATRYHFKDAQGRTATDQASWRYSDGILYERYSSGKSGKNSIKWIDQNTFDLTIIDNGTPSYAGLKRRYHRVNQLAG
jgi:serine/threonine-protein kinase